MSRASGAVLGRPRAFDLDEALDKAMTVFWEQGYEGASLTDLTSAMGITKTSMYAAFGNKEELFRKALDRYNAGPGGYLEAALECATARSVAAAILGGAIETTTRPDRPHGCLTVQAALVSGAGAEPAHALLLGWRNDAGERLAQRFRRAVADGDLPPDTDAAALARYVMTVVFGLSVQAANGVDRAELREVAEAALRHWPR